MIMIFNDVGNAISKLNIHIFLHFGWVSLKH